MTNDDDTYINETKVKITSTECIGHGRVGRLCESRLITGMGMTYAIDFGDGAVHGYRREDFELLDQPYPIGSVWAHAPGQGDIGVKILGHFEYLDGEPGLVYSASKALAFTKTAQAFGETYPHRVR